MSLVLTKAALALKNAENNFKVVKFESHKSKKKKDSKDTDKIIKTPQQIRNSNQNVDIKKIRHEVVKFGMSGFDATKKEEAKIALAISLGAKPPKRQYINYKELMQKRIEEKRKQKEEKMLMASKMVLHGANKKKKKALNDVGHFLSEYGKVQKRDLKNNDNNHPKKKRKK